MAFIQCDFYSEVLGVSTSVNVLLPEQTTTQIGMEGRSSGRKHPTLYLLHGLSDDHSIWMRRTAVERYAAPLGIAVVMPNIGRSFYTDMACGYNYWTFLSEELPRVCQSFFPLSDRQEDTFVAGLSMGGYGAFKWALRQPDRFAAAASLSGAMRVQEMAERVPHDYRLIFGEGRELAAENDLFALAAKAAEEKTTLPRLYQCCGTTDFLFEENTAFRDHLLNLGITSHYEEEEGTAHEWAYWDRQIAKVLNWLPVNGLKDNE
ncbi:alpha/beta hydrolase family protein [Paenibacillus sp. FJAT-26967]|uniref:alpha/beta hydrolase n=1 Tax=Paenibacillus sp. FJAT-26967 TaxID=1729690 RepID=UPI000838B312|nr:alpha/beta hydrolase family protein [Paenibacillus sp. FJAT-26967]